MIWPFSIFAGSKPCECDGAEVKCNIISSNELRKIRNKRIQDRLNGAIENIRSLLKHTAEYGNSSSANILIPKEFESKILEELAKCNINVDLSSRFEWTTEELDKAHPITSHSYYVRNPRYDKIDTIQYKVSF